MRNFLVAVLLLCNALLAGAQSLNDSHFVLLRNDSPLVAFRILFRTGAMDDPAGKEGLASLAAS
ncbi:MAG TPA: hypothetical protein VI958_07250, partial [Acidobacteriota bacterium]